MGKDRSSLDSDLEFGTAGSAKPSPMGGGGTTNIGGGTSGATMGNADTDRNSARPINDITETDSVGDTDIAGGITDEKDEMTKRARR